VLIHSSEQILGRYVPYKKQNLFVKLGTKGSLSPELNLKPDPSEDDGLTLLGF
jgi:hypothetical protein